MYYDETCSVLLLLSDSMNVHFKTRYWNGTIWKRFFDKPEKRTSLWALSCFCMMFPCAQGCFRFPSGLPHGRRRAGPWAPLQGKGMQEDGLSQKSLAGCLLGPIIWVCMFLCTMDFEHLDFFHQVHFNHYSSFFLSEALCFAGEQPELREK